MFIRLYGYVLTLQKGNHAYCDENEIVVCIRSMF